MEHVDVLVVGGGSAGLSIGHELASRRIEHLVLERGRIGQAWRSRWDSFCLVTPNWTVRLTDETYDGVDPDGFMPRDDIVAHLERYATAAGSPIREGVEVTAIEQGPQWGFVAQTSAGEIHADRVVLGTGAFQRANRPSAAASLPDWLPQFDLPGYRNPAALPPGRVLIVGSGQSGCQLAEELREAGRDVVLSCGKAPWVPRRIGGRDIFWWLAASGFMDEPVAGLPSPAARLGANPLATGHGGGHDLHLRTLRAKGVTLVGRFIGGEGRATLFAPDLAETVAWGDARYRDIMAKVIRAADDRGLPLPEIVEPAPFDAAGAPEQISLEGFGAVVFTGGFRPGYRSWLPWTDAFDEMGFPIQVDGASTVVDGLYFIGVHFLRTRKSSTLFGVGEDAAIIARAIASAPPS